MTTTSAGTSLGVSASPPATQDAAGYSALTFTRVGGVESIAAFGPQTAVNSFQPLSGQQEKHKGPTSYGSLQIPLALDSADAGQALLRTSASPATHGMYAFQVIFPNGDKRYFQGRAFGMPETVDLPTNVLMATATVEINTKPIIPNFLLMESGIYALLEAGDQILMES